MKSLLRFITWGAALILIVLALTAAWLTWYFDLNDHRVRIAAALSEQTGLSIELNGKIDHYILNGLQVSIRDLTVRQGDVTVADVERLQAGISLHELLNRRLEFNGMEIIARRLNLVLGATPPAHGEQPSTPEGIALPIDGLSINSLKVELREGQLDDPEHDLKLRIQNLAASIGPLPLVVRSKPVVDDPSWVMGHAQQGKIQIQSLAMNDTRLQDLELTFENDHGEVHLKRFSTGIGPGKPQAPDAPFTHLQGSGALHLHFDEPAQELPNTPWEAIDDISLRQISLLLEPLRLDTPGGPLILRDTQIDAASLALWRNGRMLPGLLTRNPAGGTADQPLAVSIAGRQLSYPGLLLTDFSADLSSHVEERSYTVALSRGRFLLDVFTEEDFMQSVAGDITANASFQTTPGKQPGVLVDKVLLSGLDLTLRQARLESPEGPYDIRQTQLQASGIPLLLQGSWINPSEPKQLTRTLSGVELQLTMKKIAHDQREIDAISITVDNRDDGLFIKHAEVELAGTRLKGEGQLRLDDHQHPWQLRLGSPRIALRPLLAFFNSDFDANGDLALELTLNGNGLIPGQWIEALDGSLHMSGRDLDVQGIDLDQVLTHLEKSQSVGLLDVGAYALAGPAGALLTKGTDYSKLIDSAKRKGSNRLHQLNSTLRIDAGVVRTEDVAITTPKHRLAVKGTLDLRKNGPIALQIATLDPQGCVRYMEQIDGSVSDPQVSQAGVVIKGVLNPVKSVVGGVLGVVTGNCPEPFYQGVVQAPPTPEETGLGLDRLVPRL